MPLARHPERSGPATGLLRPRPRPVCGQPAATGPCHLLAHHAATHLALPPRTARACPLHPGAPS